MLELDVILQPYFDRALEQLDETGWHEFIALLAEPDPDIYSWLMGYAQPENPANGRAIARIRASLPTT
ncbi:succinate dehydrogenase assembly factor 2 [Permianibacter sp. IMCC34836]|nr:succinate dehydrogenase assembly factor 2 [Permianibacter fluminis]